METTVPEVKKILLERKRELEEKLLRLEKNKRRGGESLSADSSEQAIELQNDEVVDSMDQMESLELERVTQALKAIEDGVYGKCLDCGELISPARLKALPLATNCLECASE